MKAGIRQVRVGDVEPDLEAPPQIQLGVRFPGGVAKNAPSPVEECQGVAVSRCRHGRSTKVRGGDDPADPGADHAVDGVQRLFQGTGAVVYPGNQVTVEVAVPSCHALSTVMPYLWPTSPVRSVS